MSSEIKLAFDSLDARAAALADETMKDRISLRDHIVEVEIGAFQVERGVTQRVQFNVVVEVLGADTPLEDDVDRILSYDTITEAISSELAADRLNLLETLAENIADRILLAPQAARVFIRIEKLDRGSGALGVEIVRQPGAKLPSSVETVRPVVVFLGTNQIDNNELPGVIDKFREGGAPLILCVDHPTTARPQGQNTHTTRRIDLLALEQNAWFLAAQDPRCVVVSTRTELDWAMKNGQISVWAPSKIVMDSPEASKLDASDAYELAGWFAKEMDAVQLVGDRS